MGLAYLLEFYRRLKARQADRPEVVIIPPGWKLDSKMLPKAVAPAHRRYRYGCLTRREARKPRQG